MGETPYRPELGTRNRRFSAASTDPDQPLGLVVPSWLVRCSLDPERRPEARNPFRPGAGTRRRRTDPGRIPSPYGPCGATARCRRPARTPVPFERDARNACRDRAPQSHRNTAPGRDLSLHRLGTVTFAVPLGLPPASSPPDDAALARGRLEAEFRRCRGGRRPGPGRSPSRGLRGAARRRIGGPTGEGAVGKPEPRARQVRVERQLECRKCGGGACKVEDERQRCLGAGDDGGSRRRRDLQIRAPRVASPLAWAPPQIVVPGSSSSQLIGREAGSPGVTLRQPMIMVALSGPPNDPPPLPGEGRCCLRSSS